MKTLPGPASGKGTFPLPSGSRPTSANGSSPVLALLVPEALAYEGIDGVPIQYGLYAALFALLAYAVFGSSRHMIFGPSAEGAAVSAAVVAPLAANGGQDR